MWYFLAVAVGLLIGYLVALAADKTDHAVITYRFQVLGEIRYQYMEPAPGEYDPGTLWIFYGYPLEA